MKSKKALNLSLPVVLKDVAEGYATANGRNLSELVAQLLRDYLSARGIPHEASIEKIIFELRKKIPARV